MSRYFELKNNIKIYFDIILKEPLNIKLNEDIENNKDDKKNIIKILKSGKNKGELYIPGSTLKGVFRSEFENISKYLNYKNDDLFGSLEKKSRIHFNDAFLKNIENRKSMNKGEKVNLIKQIHAFTPMIGSKDYFVDKNNPYNLKNERKINVLPIETVKDNFNTYLEIRNINYKELYILIYIFSLSYQDRIKLGSNKLRGLGLVNFQIENIEIETYGNDEFVFEFSKYFEVNDDLSLKLNGKYLKKVMNLRKEFRKFNFSDENIENNEFLKFIQEMRDNYDKF